MKLRLMWLPAIALCAALSTGAPAFAADAPDETDASASPAILPGPDGVIITCNASADDPHDSGHVDGTINAELTIKCSGGATVASMTGQVTISARRGNNVVASKQGTSRTTTGFNYFKTKPNAALSCAVASGAAITNSATFTVVPPAGFYPTSFSGSVNSVLAVTCRNRSSAAEVLEASQASSSSSKSFQFGGK